MQIGAFNASVVAEQEGNTPAPKLVRAAHEFEGQMLQELLKPLSASDSLGDDEENSDSGSALSEFASEALGQALSRQGGFGIADKIVRELSHSGKQTHSGKVTGNLHGDTAMRGSE